VVKNVDAVELLVVVAAVFAAAADAVLVAYHLPKLGNNRLPYLPANMCTNPRVETTSWRGARGRKGGEERRKLRNYARQLGTGNKKSR
jgi:hypothetical protein